MNTVLGVGVKSETDKLNGMELPSLVLSLVCLSAELSISYS